jgi:tetratricopeptide (TPR) repeat protein
VRLRCQLAKQFEKTGDYAAACRVMDSLWAGVGLRPDLDTLDERTSAEVLLRIGVLSGWIGAIRLIKGSQQVSRNLMTESVAIFEALRDEKKVAEAQTEMALCCMREGSLDMARTLFAEALARLDDRDGDLKALAILRSALVEVEADRLNDALNILTGGASLFDTSANHALRGSFHVTLGNVLNSMGAQENQRGYQSVLREYTTASFHFEQAGHARYQGNVENNLALFLMELGRFAEAHEHLDGAQAIYTKLNDNFHLAALEDSRAQVLIAEGEIRKAEKIIGAAIGVLERSDQHSLLAEVLTTRGVALSRLERWEEARETFARAIDTAEQSGHLERAGLAALALIEELSEHLTANELVSIFEHAHNFLKFTQSTTILHRLNECAGRILSVIHTARPDWTTFSLGETLNRHEARFIQMALEDSGGSVTKAAALLGLPGHQSLNFILHRRHPELLNARTPIKPRRRSSFKLITPQKKVAGGEKQ